MSLQKIFLFGVCTALFSAQASASDFQKIDEALSRLDIPSGRKISENKSEFLRDLNAAISADIDGILVLVDKSHFLPADFVPADLLALKANPLYNLNKNDLSLRKCACDALAEMAAAAQKDGVSLLVSSTYRSFDYQKKLYERNVRELGKEAADRESAKAGTSQHQLGCAIDFGSITDDFAQTKQGRWLFDNAAKFGFSLSFPDGYEEITGFRWECWHYRYVGVKAIALQQKWFNNVQQYMMEFLDVWKSI